MSKRYTYTRTISGPQGPEAFTADQFDSFDEAKRAVDKGIHDRMLEIGKENKLNPPPRATTGPQMPPGSGGPMNAPFVPPGTTTGGSPVPPQA